ncbi:hypothetical protein SLS53_004992 [Cytospora paraplurivora]|uniref:EthD domain-containing protein n=1 Tax=Cytospora paraplurivora TaxID=2898453 RepID=A0AAN9UDP2_9PEZI
MANAQPLIKFDVCIYKKDNIPEEEFFNWATKVYPEKATDVIKKYGIVKWTQTVQPAQFREPIRHALKNEMGRPGWSIPDYDLVVTYWLRSLDDLKKLTTSPEWAALEEGALAISNTDKGHLVVGYETVQFENNI